MKTESGNHVPRPLEEALGIIREKAGSLRATITLTIHDRRLTQLEGKERRGLQP